MKNYWTEKRISKLSKLWEKGISAREIAEKLGDVSRNAVIGKANRLGLSKKEKSTKKIVKIDENLSLNTILPKMNGCKWPIGHPGDDDFYFCGKKVIPGKPYCGEHCMIAYRKKDSFQRNKKAFKIRSEEQPIAE